MKAFSLKLATSAILLITGVMSSVSAARPTIGRAVYTDGGSSVFSYILVIAAKPFDIQKIEIGYLSGSDGLSLPGMSFADQEDDRIAKVNYMMVNCAKRTYSLRPEHETTVSRGEYVSAITYKWDDEHSEGGLFYGSYARNEAVAFFEDACDPDRHKGLER